MARVGCVTIGALCLGDAPYAIKEVGISYFLMYFYTQVMKLDSSLVSLSVFVATLFDGLTDPIIGQWSDTSSSHCGRRHPFLYASIVPIGLSYAILWNPLAGLSEVALFVHLLCFLTLTRILIGFFGIPHAALVPELITDYDGRTKVFGARFFLAYCTAMACAAGTTELLLTPSTPAAADGLLNEVGYRSFGVYSACFMVALMLLSAIGTAAAARRLPRQPPRRRAGLAALFSDVRRVLSSRSSLAVVGAATFVSVSGGIELTIDLFVNTYFWQLSQRQISLIMLTGPASAVAGMLLALPLSRALGKKRAAQLFSLGSMFFGSALVAVRVMEGPAPADEGSGGASSQHWLPPNRTDALFFCVALFKHGALFGSIAMQILLSSMLADVVEEAQLRTGHRSEGMLSAANQATRKFGFGVGALLAGGILSAVSFPRHQQPELVEPVVVHRLGMALASTRTVLYLVAIVLLGFYQIDRKTHENHLDHIRSNRVNLFSSGEVINVFPDSSCTPVPGDMPLMALGPSSTDTSREDSYERY
ncbi:hypothetical protein AB1Y20_013384 [Prymnesium parvum]|uniref:Uncharacterized protein n=1 Tax=Prymnesium parvum TaxID=97485 RepID=A0AB34IHP9_PRYPA